ncbi:MAG: hypothetical protein HYT36_00910, partial [Candidatus Staskawiczbacteria bacterium]|nr:hypothetical protein [Candidatus Staskawiczbacteria bacterium]
MKNWIINWRINAILFFIFIIGAAIVSRLFFLEVLNHKYYQAQALGQKAGFKDILGKRGEIFFENSQGSKGAEGSGEMKSLAINKDSWTITAAVKEIEDKEYFAEALSKIINDSYENILSKL